MKKRSWFILMAVMLLMVSLVTISAATSVKVQHFTGTAATANTIAPNIKLVNTGTDVITLSNVKMRYYFTNDGTQADSFSCDWCSASDVTVTGTFVNITPVTNADRYLEVGFTGAGTLAAGSYIEVKIRVWKSDWSNFTQTNDYSYNSTTSYLDSTTIPAYISGTLYWGVAPGGPAATATPTPIVSPSPTARAATPTPTSGLTPTPTRQGATPTPIRIATPTPTPRPNTPTPTTPPATGYTPQGYGAVATGGSNVFHVTNLSDSGTGSLRDALSASGRRVVFDVAGTITITSSLVIPSNTTIDGTTAPSSGITVTGYNTSMSGKNNIIVRNIRFREDTTGPEGKCSLQGSDACYNIMIDHCSMEWGRWDCLEFTANSHDITIQYCIIGQGIDPQYFGCLIDSCDRVSIHHNLWIGNNNRNPKLKGNCQYINNVVYNWGSAGGLQGGHSSAPWKSDFLNNYFIKGPSSASDSWASDCTSNDQWYQSGNYRDLNRNGALDGTLLGTSDFTALTVTLLSSKQHSPSAAVTVDSASTAVNQAAAGNYGCQPNDSYDNSLTGYLRSYGTQGKIGK